MQDRLRQKDLAARFGVPIFTYQRWERDIYPLSEEEWPGLFEYVNGSVGVAT